MTQPFRQPLTLEQAARKQAWYTRGRSLATYSDVLFRSERPIPWQPPTIREALAEQGRLRGDSPLTVVDFGCGAAVALCGIAFALQARGVPARVVGIDKAKAVSGGDAFDLFPDHAEGRQELLTLFADEMGLPEPIPAIEAFAWPTLHRLDLEVHEWPLAPDSVHLAISLLTVPFLADKLRFMERVYAVLAPGGVALLHLDLYRHATRQGNHLRRIFLPGDVTLDSLVVDQQQRGLLVANRPSVTPWETSSVLVMRKTAGTRLDFGLQVVDACAEANMPFTPPEPWGTRTAYGPRL
ncbi:MAG: class I SAM-dependent methyltransferase [Candidatus Sericytochromatia bacterium]|nr:class I SAM-dependent methyltransferase [Candidatus Sericytochromatia bacterium]